MLELMWTAVFLMLALGIGLWLSLKIFGATGTSVLIVGVAVCAIVDGLKHLIGSDHLILQMLGWTLTTLLVWGTLKGIQLGWRWLRNEWRSNKVDTDEKVV